MKKVLLTVTGFNAAPYVILAGSFVVVILIYRLWRVMENERD